MTENRKYKRSKVKIKAFYSYDAHTDKKAKVIDISKGGMYVETEYAPEMKGYFLASLDVEDLGKVIWVQGHIVRKTNIGVGVMFTKTDENGLDKLLLSRSAKVLIPRKLKT